MKRLSKILCIMLAAIICMGICSGCGKSDGKDVGKKQGEVESEKKGEDKQDNEGKTKEGETTEGETAFPIVDEPITLTIMARYRTGMADFKDMLTWQEYEKLSNVKVEWIMVENQGYSEKRNLALATGDLPDAFLKGNFGELDLLKYGQQGTFIPLNDLIENHAPNLKRILEDERDYPGVREAYTMADGNIYSIGYIMHKDLDPVRYSPKLFMNRKWLDALGKDMPTTTDEFYDVLKSFKLGDPNKNGSEDEIPLWSSNIPLSILKGAWGLNNRGLRVANVDMDPAEEGKLRFVPIDPKYKDMLEYINKLYSEDLIDEEMFATDLADLLSKGEQNLIGAFALAGNTYVGSEHEDDFEGLEVALKGPHGDQLWAATQPAILSKGSFVITNANEYPEETMRWIDYFYSEEGMKLYFLGKEGVTYRETEDGECEFLDVIINNPEGLDFQDALNKYVPFAIGDNPALLSPKYFQGAEMQPIPAEAASRMKPYGVQEPWPTFNFTLEENDKMVALANDIHSYVSEKTAEFVTGQAQFSEWDEYVNTLEKMGLQEYMDIYQAAYERTFEN